MTKKLTTAIVASIAFVGIGAATITPAQARPDVPVRVGKDSCGNLNVWINDQPVFIYLYCGPPNG